MRAGDIFPPVKVIYDQDKYYLVDGHHTCSAAIASNLTEIKAEITEGTLYDAIIASCAANTDHGIARSTETKRRQVMTILNSKWSSNKSDRAIAEHCKVSHTFVSKIRAKNGNVATEGVKVVTQTPNINQIVKIKKERVIGKVIEVNEFSCSIQSWQKKVFENISFNDLEITSDRVSIPISLDNNLLIWLLERYDSLESFFESNIESFG
jgi:hypothetical protein